MLALARLASLCHPLQRLGAVAAGVAGQDEAAEEHVDESQRGVDQPQLGAGVLVNEDRDQEPDRVEDDDAPRGAGDPAQPCEPGSGLVYGRLWASGLTPRRSAAGLRCPSTVRAPPPGRTVMLRRLALSKRSPPACSSQASSRCAPRAWSPALRSSRPGSGDGRRRRGSRCRCRVTHRGSARGGRRRGPGRVRIVVDQVGVGHQADAGGVGPPADVDWLHHESGRCVGQHRTAAQRLLDRGREVGVAVAGGDVIGQPLQDSRVAGQAARRPRRASRPWSHDRQPAA